MRNILFLTLCLLSMKLAAQTKYTDRIQADKSGGGSLTLHQSQAITDLVNTSSAPSRKPHQGQAIVTPKDEHDATATAQDETTVGQKMSVNGYRIQIYSGNNSRQGKNEAAAMGRRSKEYFAELPVYTLFKSPHWICRVGDFRTMEEASEYLRRMQENGRFAEAVIVRSKVTVYY